MIEERVRYLLENRSLILENLEKLSRLMIVNESEKEIIEAIVLAAKAFRPDAARNKEAGEKIYKVIAQKDKQVRNQDESRNLVAWVVESQSQEIEELDATVSKLHANQVRVVVARFYEDRSCEECAAILNYSRENVSRIVSRAIRDITEKWGK